MQLSDFTYHLPERLIAQHPVSERSASRMLGLNRDDGRISHHRFVELLEFLRSEDVLVFNNTRVIPARLYGRKESGGRIEILIERQLGRGQLLTQLRASKSPKPGCRIVLTLTHEGDESDQANCMTVERREGEFFVLAADSQDHLQSLLKQFGHVPLPPYIKREDELQDRERYQTVYAEVPGRLLRPRPVCILMSHCLQLFGRRGSVRHLSLCTLVQERFNRCVSRTLPPTRCIQSW